MITSLDLLIALALQLYGICSIAIMQTYQGDITVYACSYRPRPTGIRSNPDISEFPRIGEADDDKNIPKWSGLGL